jgi:hypothetical protein
MSGTSLHTFTPDPAAIDAVIEALESRPFLDLKREADIFRALGWAVKAPIVRGRWRIRSPIQSDWQDMPWPSLFVTDAARLVPYGWSWAAGVDRVPVACVHLPHQPAEFRCQGVSPALALTKAALLAQRWCVMRQAVPA